MNPPTMNPGTPRNPGGVEVAEATLRLLAALPAPEGLEDRVKDQVKAALRAAPRAGHLLSWPAPPTRSRGWLDSSLARGAAAAAIVLAVVGGGWGVYSRVQPAQTPQAVTVPHMVAPGGFSSADAIRTPQTLNGPVLRYTAPKHPSALPTAQANANAAAQADKKPLQAGKTQHRKKAASESVQ